MNWRNLGWGIVLGIVCSHAGAVEPWVPNDVEMMSLPPFCKAKMKSGPGSSDYKLWESTLGKDFLHTHHYCVGINFINRYYRSHNRQDKQFNLNSAVGNLTYMVEHAAPDYSLMPDVYLNRGLAYSLMKQHGKAIADMNKAIELNPRQAKAYSVLVDYYSSTNQQNKALETATEGLRHNPDARSLQRRYTKLGGKLPYPEAIEPTPVAVPQAVEPTQVAVPQAVTPVDVLPVAPAEVSPPPAPDEQPKIGSPNNPYCRFCVD